MEGVTDVDGQPAKRIAVEVDPFGVGDDKPIVERRERIGFVEGFSVGSVHGSVHGHANCGTGRRLSYRILTGRHVSTKVAAPFARIADA